MVDELERRQAPLARMALVGQLARLANHFRGERPAESWTMLFEDYASDLDGISGEYLAQIVEDWRQSKPWFPKVCELLDRWNAAKSADALRLHRARVLLGQEQAKAWERI